MRDDVLVFSASGFAGDLLVGEVSSEMFALGTVAITLEHRFIYDDNNGNFFYDSDGIGDHPQKQLAVLNSGLNLSNDNLLIEI